jgi:exodeoxyribonuclease VII large subunit
MTVTQLAQGIRLVLSEAFPVAVSVRGEIANFTHQPSGHMYFTLRDEGAALRCAMFRGANRHLRFEPGNGMEVVARGEVGLYVRRGDVQLVVEEMQPAGLGAQMAALEALKEALAAEGLLAPERKRPLPLLPRAVGLVTSPRGAAIRDLLEILGRRAPGVDVVVSPTLVQGEGAALMIAAAIERLGGAGLVDVLIVARGGGSLEDLWAFNLEPVARAIASCPVPVVSGVGHEVDVTLSDLVADVRAATPSHAAELVVPDVAELAARLDAAGRRLVAVPDRRLRAERQRLAALSRSYVFRRPERLLRERAQRLDELWTGLGRLLVHRLERAAGRLESLPGRLVAAAGNRQRRAAHTLDIGRQRLLHAGAQLAPGRRATLAMQGARLRALGPLQVMGRGYVVVRRVDGDGEETAAEVPGQVVARAAGVQAGERLRLEWIDGHARSRVESVEPAPVPGAPPAARHREA